MRIGKIIIAAVLAGAGMLASAQDAARPRMTREQAESVLDSAEARETAATEDEQAREMGVSGVPFFIFNGRLAVSGAHPAETLFQAMSEAVKAE